MCNIMNSREYFGEGSIKTLKIILDEMRPSSVFLVTGKKS